MNQLFTLFVSLITPFLLLSCAKVLQPNDTVLFQADQYPFMKERFIDHSMRCLFLREDAVHHSALYFCSGVNYSNQFSEGVVFVHVADAVKERMIGATLALDAPQGSVEIKCISEMPNDAIVGQEYLLCMTQQRYFDWARYLAQVDSNVSGRLFSGVQSTQSYDGMLTPERANRLIKFLEQARQHAKTGGDSNFVVAPL